MDKFCETVIVKACAPSVRVREEETISHLLHCPWMSALWATRYTFMGLCWVRADQLSKNFGHARCGYPLPQVGVGIISPTFDFLVSLERVEQESF